MVASCPSATTGSESERARADQRGQRSATAGNLGGLKFAGQLLHTPGSPDGNHGLDREVVRHMQVASGVPGVEARHGVDH